MASASQNGHVDVLRVLLSEGADINVMDGVREDKKE